MKVPHFSKSSKLVLDVLSKLFFDISQKYVDTRSHNKASEISDYFDNLPLELHPSDNEIEETKPFSTADIDDEQIRPRRPKPPTQPATTQAPPTTAPKPPRLTLAPSRHTFAQPKDEKSVQLLREAAKIRLREMPLAAAFVLRAFLQQTIDLYMTENSLPFWENNKQLELAIRADRVIKHLIQNQRALSKDLAGAKRMLATGSDPASIKALNDYHHDRYQVPAVDVLRSAWDSAIPLFNAVFGPA